jgi:hypothetical protein
MTITLTREEAQQVLDALQELNKLSVGENAICLPAEIDGAMEVLEARLAQSEPDYRDVVISGDLWRIEFLPDHAASVVLVKANYEAQSEPKPVVYLRRKEFAFGYEQVDREDHGAIPVYTVPPQRKWQGLTSEEIMDACAAVWASHPIEVGHVVQDLLKEKNT